MSYILPRAYGDGMPTHEVNLDALIPRENLATTEESAGGKPSKTFTLSQLEGPFYHLLRKPDFQRDTCGWKPRLVVELVKNFLDGELIPSIILWCSPSNRVFVIDGGHRLSSLIAWLHDDYGDGVLTESRLGKKLAEEQVRIAKATRRLMEKEIGAYAHLKMVASKKSKARDADQERRAGAVFLEAIDVRWLEGTPEKAEESFYRVNSSSVQIDNVELAVIRARRKPNAIAVRAVMNPRASQIAGESFGAENVAKMQALAVSIHDTLFMPPLPVPIKTMDLPIAGNPYSAEGFRAVLDLVDIVCSLNPSKWADQPDDTTGAGTIEVLQKVWKIAQMISSSQYAGSLGLHPAVYFYGSTGRFHPPSLLATAEFIMDLEKRNKFFEFTKVRARFEDFLVSHKLFVNELGKQLGSRRRPVEAILSMYKLIFECLEKGIHDEKEIVTRITNEARLSKLKGLVAVDDTQYGKSFSIDTISAGFLKDAIGSAVTCTECKARLHVKAITVDHVVPQSAGGLGSPQNLAFTHPYCNSGFKEKKAHLAAGGKSI